MQSSAVSDEQRMEHYMSVFDCRTLNEMYNKLKHLAKIHLNENKVPFSLSAIVHPTSDSQGRDVEMYLSTLKSIYQGDNSALTAKNLIEKLKKDIPKDCIHQKSNNFFSCDFYEACIRVSQKKWTNVTTFD